jgi:hypothetical protein
VPVLHRVQHALPCAGIGVSSSRLTAAAWNGLTLARRLRDQNRATEHLLNLSWVYLDENWPRGERERNLRKARAIAAQGMRRAERLGYREYALGFMHRLGAVALDLRDLDTARKTLEAGFQSAAQIQHRWYVSLLGVELGRLYMMLGESREAWRVLEIARENADHINNPLMVEKAKRTMIQPAPTLPPLGPRRAAETPVGPVLPSASLPPRMPSRPSPPNPKT